MIETRNLTKRFGDITAVDHVSADIREGSVFGLIGTNGAGKSTFLRLLSGVLKPDEGSVTIDGQEVFEHTFSSDSKIPKRGRESYKLCQIRSLRTIR